MFFWGGEWKARAVTLGLSCSYCYPLVLQWGLNKSICILGWRLLCTKEFLQFSLVCNENKWIKRLMHHIVWNTFVSGLKSNIIQDFQSISGPDCCSKQLLIKTISHIPCIYNISYSQDLLKVQVLAHKTCWLPLYGLLANIILEYILYLDY